VIIRFYFLILLLSTLSFSVDASSDALPVPSVDQHAKFLMEPWKPNAPVLLIFTDPFCPYCIKALKRREELKSYNVFLFWYPIFGERSDNRVSEIFQCASPVSDQVINSVIKGESPACTNAVDKNLMLTDRKFYEAYSPQGVPAYYMGGVKVSVAELKAWHKSLAVVAPSVKLDWSRYKINRVDINSSNLSKVMVILPHNYQNKDLLVSALKANAKFEWYWFEDDKGDEYKNSCHELVGKCGAQVLNQYVNTTQEIKLLYGLEDISKVILILNGKVLSDAETISYLDFLKDVIS